MSRYKIHLINSISRSFGPNVTMAVCGYSNHILSGRFGWFMRDGKPVDCKNCLRIYSEARDGIRCCTNPLCKITVKEFKKLKKG